MNSNLSRATYQVKGMTCVGCEHRIEKILSKMEGVMEVNSRFSNSSLSVEYDGDLVTLGMMEATVNKAGYTLILKDDKTVSMAPTPRTDARGSAKSTLSLLQLIGIAVIILTIYLIIQNTIGFNFMPATTPSMGYGALFVVGLFTSLHCLSMCGGINMSQCVSYAKPTDGTSSKLRISGTYNLGRVISYTIVGGIVGALGSVVEFAGWAKGSVAVASGLFMVVLGISMLGFFPWINKITPRMPRFITTRAGKTSKSKGPFIVGLLTGLMPCGPLQAMQIYALGTGSFVTGALSMFVFSLGTVPLMFGLGTVSTLLGSKFTNRMLKASAVLVLILGIVMINHGLVLSGVNAIALPSFFDTQVAGETQIQDGIQHITSRVLPDAYPEITVKKGIPAEWTLQVAEGDLNTCNNEIIIPAFGIKQKLQVGSTSLMGPTDVNKQTAPRFPAPYTTKFNLV